MYLKKITWPTLRQNKHYYLIQIKTITILVTSLLVILIVHCNLLYLEDGVDNDNLYKLLFLCCYYLNLISVNFMSFC